MSNFSFNKAHALSSAAHQSIVERLHNDIDNAIVAAVEQALPAAIGIELYCPNGVKSGLGFTAVMRTQISALEADGFKVVVRQLEESYAVIDVVWGELEEETEEAVNKAESEIETHRFEKEYTKARNQLKQELFEIRKKAAYNTPEFIEAIKTHNEAEDEIHGLMFKAYLTACLDTKEWKADVQTAKSKLAAANATIDKYEHYMIDFSSKWYDDLAYARSLKGSIENA